MVQSDIKLTVFNKCTFNAWISYVSTKHTMFPVAGEKVLPTFKLEIVRITTYVVCSIAMLQFSLENE